MPDSPTISIVIPTYNMASYAPTAVESCLAQSFGDFEIILVDDGSIDDTLSVLRPYTADPRVRLLELGVNRGVSAARNAGFDAARGEFITTLDADDAMLPQRLEKLLAAARELRTDLVHDDLLLLHEDEDEPYATLSQSTCAAIDEPTPVTLERMVNCEIGGSSAYRLGLAHPLMVRDFIERHHIRYDTRLRVGEDYLFYMECVLAGARWMQLPEADYVYLQRAGSAANSNPLVATLVDKLSVCNELVDRPGLLTAQQMQLRRYQRNLRSILAYHRVVEPAKNGQLLTAARAAITNPRFVRRLAEEFPAIIRRRWAYHVRRDKRAFEMLPARPGASAARPSSTR